MEEKDLQAVYNAMVYLKATRTAQSTFKQSAPVIIGTGERLTNRDLTGPELAVLSISKINPNSILANLSNSLSNLNIKKDSVMSEDQIQKATAIARQNLLNTFGSAFKIANIEK